MIGELPQLVVVAEEGVAIGGERPWRAGLCRKVARRETHHQQRRERTNHDRRHARGLPCKSRGISRYQSRPVTAAVKGFRGG
jgi:hypothetical protein